MDKLMRRSSKAKKEGADRCKKHPKHQQSPGVCSLCLREKLEKVSHKLSSTLPRRNNFSISPSSMSSYYSSSSGSSCSSPAEPAAYEQKGTVSWLFMSGGGGENNVLSKSRSMVNYFREKEEKKKSRRFWSKLLRPISKRREEASLVHSRTVREMRLPTMVL